jgi:tetratricopeptide (TPR) repeat protein
MRKAAALVSVVWVLFLSAKVHAREDSDKAAAVALLREGNAHLDRGQFQQALEKFEEAYKRFPSAKIFYSEGQALCGLNRNAEAIVAFRRFLVEADDASAEHRAEARKVVARLRAESKPEEVDSGKVGEPNRTRAMVGEAAPEPSTGEIGVAAPSNVAEPVGIAKESPPPGLPLPVPSEKSSETPEVAGSNSFERPIAPVVPLGEERTAGNPDTTFEETGESKKAEPSNWLRVIGLASAGIGLVSVVAGVFIWSSAVDKNDEAASQWQSGANSWARLTRATAEERALEANICFVGGGILAGAGVLITVLSFRKSHPQRLSLMPTYGPGIAGIAASGIW